MNIPFELYAGSRSALAVYRPAGIGFGELLPSDLGIACYNGLDIETLRGLDAHREADAELRARLTELDAEADGRPFNAEQRAEFEEISAPETGLLARVTATIEELEIRERAILEATVNQTGRAEPAASTYAVPNVRRTPENVYDLAAYRQRVTSIDDLPAAYHDGAKRALELASFPTAPDAAKARGQVEKILAKHKDDANGAISRRVIGTSNPAYIEAWGQYVAQGKDGMSPARWALLQTYSDPDGGVAIPVTIDPTFILTSDGAVNPLRQPGWSKIVTITTKSWSPVTTGGVTAAYVGERTTTGASDAAPSDFDGPVATPVQADVFVKFTASYQEDYGAAAIASELGGLIQDAKDVLEADKFIMGDGTGEPEGIVAALIADTTSIVPTITDNVFALDDIDKLIAALPPRFRNTARARFLANLAIYQLARGFGDAGQTAGSIYDPISKILRGYVAGEASAMDDVATDAKEILLLGAFEHFVIVDRLGLTTEFVPQVFDGDGKPLGARGVYARWRNTSKLLFPNAFRLLKVQ